jgi:hypothetical protein
MAALLSGDGALARERMRTHVKAVRSVSADYVRPLTPSDGAHPERPQRASVYQVARACAAGMKPTLVGPHARSGKRRR